MPLRLFVRIVLMASVACAVMCATIRAANAPVIFYEDLQSGPNAGGESVSGFAGAYVTLYGNFFGSSQGSSSVTLGGSSCLRVVSWGSAYLWYQKITIQLGPNCSTGSMVVSVNGSSSNALPFTVRAGNIFCVATSGSDNNSGKFPSCWATVPHAASSMAAGDITYVRNGVAATSDNGFGSPLNISGVNGTQATPLALVVYPGESAAIGGSSNSRGIIQYPNTSSYWTVAGFTMTFSGSGEAIHLYQGSGGWRIVSNSISCPTGDGFTGCVTTDGAPNVSFIGNVIHDTGATGADKTYHAFYFGDHGTTGNANIDVGWNSVYNIHGCRGIMFHSIDSTPGAEGYNLTIHDNVVHDVQCDGIALANVNPDKGPIKIFNNVVYHVGTGPDPQGQGANYSCLYVGDSNGNPSTAVLAYNNTCYDGGSRGASEGDAGAVTAYIPLLLTNNIFYELSGEAYLSNSTASQCSSCISGTNNIWFGIGSGPSQTKGNLNVDPQFVDGPSHNFSLKASSPAVGAGAAVTLPFDVTGVQRGSPVDLGAFQFGAGTTVQLPSPPTNLQVTVN